MLRTNLEKVRTLQGCLGLNTPDRLYHAASVEVDEQNGSSGSPTLSHNITNSNMGSTDAINLDPVANPVTPGNNTFEKWQKIHVTAMGGSSQIDTLKVWRTGALGGAAVHLTNARTSAYAGAATYTTPTASASSTATQTMPTSTPGSANLGIGGSLAGNLQATGSSDFCCHQVQTNAADVSGSTSTLNLQYNEVA